MKYPVFAAVVLGIMLSLNIHIFAADRVSVRKGVKFESEDGTLTITDMDMRSAMKFNESPPATHHIELKGYLKIPAGKDVVAIQKMMTVGRTIDKRQMSLKSLARSSSSDRKYKSGTYTWVDEKSGIGEIEIKRMELKASPYTIASMEVESNLVIAAKKTPVELPATIMDKAKTIVPGLKVRIISLSSKRKGTYVITGEFERSATGPQLAFFDKVFCLDNAGKELGGGRFEKGDPMGDKGKLICSLSVRDATAITKLRFIVVTKSQIKPVTFQLKDIFQK